MTDTLIGFELAKLAKEKKFPQLLCYTESRHYYSTWKYAIEDHEVERTDDWTLFRKDFQWSRWDIEEESRFDYYFEAPTQSLLQKWLRDVYNINVLIAISTYDGDYCFEIWKTLEGEHPYLHCEDPRVFETYEEALEQALIDALNLI